MDRKNPLLQEAIDQLDARLAEAGGNTKLAWESLSPVEMEFAEGEAAKILQSPRYYLENYHFISSKQIGLSPLWPLWDAQEMFLEVFERQYAAGGPIRMVVLKARQLGVTTISVAILFWIAITRHFVRCLSMSDEEDKVLVNFDIARSAWDNLVWWFRPEKRYDIRGRFLGFDCAKEEDRRRGRGLRSQIMFESANQPSGAAYSKSIFAGHLAELARYRSSKSISEGVLGSLATLPGSVGIMESTAQKRHDTWHRICKAAQDGRMPWEFLFVEWFREPGYRMAVPVGFARTEEEAAICAKAKEETEVDLDDGQLAWRRMKKAEFEATEGNPEKFAQEFPMNPAEAFVAKGACAFSKRRLHEMLEHFVRPPRWTGEILLQADDKSPSLSKVEDGPLSVWEWPEKGSAYYVSGDPSLGVEGGDPGCAEVFLVPENVNEPLRQVAEWHGWIGPTQFARVLAAIGYLYNTAEVSPECVNITTVASDLVKVLNYPNWYRWMREDKARNMYSMFIGWQTNHRNKGDMIGRMREALNEWTVVLRSEELVEEMFDFVDDSGAAERFEARLGAHDDRVMAAMIAFYCATQLRPRLGETQEEIARKPPPGADWQNTEFSAVHDDKETWDWNQDQAAQPPVPTFDML